MGEEKEIISRCPSCGSKYKVPFGFLGKSLACKKCGTSFKLTDSSPNEAKKTTPEQPTPDEKMQDTDVEDSGLMMGKLAVKYGYASEDQIRDAIAFQDQEKREGRKGTLGEILVGRGVISQDQLKSLISVQQFMEERQLDLRFGATAVQVGFAAKRDIENALMEQRRVFKEKKIFKRIGDILVDNGIITPENREFIHEKQSRRSNGSSISGTDGPPQASGPSSEMVITISEDGLSAFVSLKNEECSRLSGLDVKEVLAARGICYGVVDEGTLAQILKAGPRADPVMIAQGMRPVPGGEVTLRYLFDTDPLKIREAQEGAMIDFRERGPLPQVKKGDLLAEKVWPEDAIPGVDVFGKEIRAPVSKDAQLRPGSGTLLSPDGMKLYADAEGRPELRADGTVYVFSDLEIDGDVDLKTGHVDFQGGIVVSGTVQSGFRVKGGNLTANEILKAEVETTGEVAVFGGIIGAAIRAGGPVRARYIHDSTVEALGDIVVEKEILDSNIETSGRCSVKKGHILSCAIQAKKGIEAGEIGSDSSRQCTLVVGTNERARNEIERLRKEASVKRQAKKELNILVQELEREVQKVNAQIGKLAQEQDRDLVNKRKISTRLEEMGKSNATAQVEAGRKLLQALEQAIREREILLESSLETQDKIADQVSVKRAERGRVSEELAAIDSEIAAIAQWSQADQGNPVVKVVGSINQYTAIKGLYSSLILPETHTGVIIKEIKTRIPDEKAEWRMKISKI